MNMIFGSATTLPENNYFQLLSDEIEKNYDTKAMHLSGKTASVKSGYITDNGVVLGCARQDSHSLIYLGVLQKPLPKWNHPAPSDDPNVTAQYLLSRYQELGLEFLDNVFGHYSVVICNQEENKLILGCDPGGVSTLYYTEVDGSLAFSSNLYCLVSALKNRIELDRSYEDFFLIYGFMPWNKVFFKEVKHLSGNIVEWHRGNVKIQNVDKKDPWQKFLPDIDFNNATEDEVIDILYDGFMHATEEQLASSMDAAVLLGGFDSALVASALSRLGKKVETFSFFYDNPQFNQTHTDTLANYLKINHNWILINDEAIRNGMQRYSLKFNRPTNWPNYLIQTEYLCSEIRKRGILHCFSGDGCDHVFLGYPRTHVMSKFFNAPIVLPHVVLNLVLKIAEWSVLEDYFGRPYRVGVGILRNLAREKHIRGHIYFNIFDELSLKRLRNEPPPDQELGIDEILESLAEGLKGLSPDRLTYHGKSAASANKAKMLGSSHSSGLAIMSPYLHPGMSRIANQIPDRLLRPDKKTESQVTGKYILLKMAEKKKLLPKDVIYQKKIAAVDAPIDQWYSGPLKPMMLELMKSLPFKCNEEYVSNLLKPKYAEEIYRRYLSSDHLTSHEISLLATYASFTKALREE